MKLWVYFNCQLLWVTFDINDPESSFLAWAAFLLQPFKTFSHPNFEANAAANSTVPNCTERWELTYMGGAEIFPQIFNMEGLK